MPKLNSRNNFHALEVKTNVTDRLKVACFKGIASVIRRANHGEALDNRTSGARRWSEG
jgi:hypothetical protein